MARILIVEDDPDVRQLLATMVTTAGHDAVCCENGKVASELVLALGEHPDLVVSDLRMPVMDGLELVAELRSNRLTKRIPFLLLTAVPEDLRATKVLGYARTALRAKPVATRQLRETITALLEGG